MSNKTPKKEQKELLAKQKLFAKHYLATFSEVKAAELAGYEKSWSRSLMKNPLIRAEINKGINTLFEKHGVEQDAIVKQLSRIAFEQNPQEMGIKYSDQIQALKLLGVQIGMFQEKKEEKVLQPPSVTVIIDSDTLEKTENIDETKLNSLPGRMVQ